MTFRFSVYLILLLLITIYGVLNLKRLSTPFKLVTLLIGLTFLSEVLSRVLISTIKNSAPADHAYAIAEFVLIAFIYFYLFKNVRIRYALLIAIPVFIVAEIVNLLFFQSILEFPSVLLSVQELACVVFSLFYFAEMLLNPIDVPLFSQSAFWLNASLFLFSAIIFLCFGLMNSLIVSQVTTKTLSIFIYWVNLIFYSFIWLSVSIDAKNKISA